MFPIRVVVESVRSGECCRCSNAGNTVVDSYAIVNGQTPVSQIVDTVLTALGLQQLASGAKGMVEINNWRPLSFDSITDNLDLTADVVLKDVANHATLRILTKHHDSASSDCAREMRDRLLRTVIQRHPQIMNTIKNPQLQDFVGQMLQADASVLHISAEQMQGFNHWLDELASQSGSNGNSWFGQTSPGAAAVTSNGVENTQPSMTQPSMAPSLTGMTGGFGVGRFHNTLELPKLIRWFSENDNPSRAKMQQFVHLLNQGSYRKNTNNKITYPQLSNWFSNARQLQRIQMMANNLLNAAAAATAGSSGVSATAAPQNESMDLSVSGPNGPAHSSGPANQTSPSASSTSASSGHNSSSSSHRFDLNSLLHAKEAEQQQRMKEEGSDKTKSEQHDQSPASAEEGAESPDSSTNQPEVAEKTANSDVHLNVDLFQNMARVNADLAALINQANGGAVGGDGDLKLNIPGVDLHSMVTLPGAADVLAQMHMENNELLTTLKPDPAALLAAASPYGGGSPQSTFTSTPPHAGGGAGATSSTPRPVHTPSSGNNNNNSNSSQFTGSRSRLMFDPLSELPLLERWFEENPHPSWIQIDFFTETLNNQPYRKQYPPISTHNVKIWFKNRRAKNKRLFDAGKAKAAAALAAQNNNAGLNLTTNGGEMAT